MKLMPLSAVLHAYCCNYSLQTLTVQY